MVDEQHRFARDRRELTELFVLLALTRKKLHITTPPREVRDGWRFDPSTWDAKAYALAIATRLLPAYAPTATMTVAS